MDDRFNTLAGWALGAGIVALGCTLLAGEYYHHEHVEKGGYHVEEAEAGGGGGAAAAAPIDWSKADVAKGEEAFKQCTQCHTINAGGANGQGPNLYGVLGRAKASVAGFGYSDDLKGIGGAWSFEDMDAWIRNPRKVAKGTRMSFGGMADNVKRASLIAYINAQGSNKPLPAAAAAPAAAEAAPAADAAAAATPAAANAAAPAAK